MNRLLLVSDVPPDGVGGRAEKFDRRRELLEKGGWEVTITTVENPIFIAITILKVIWMGGRNEIDVVNTVNNPLHLHVIGFLLNVAFGIPWVAEYRDPLVNNPDRGIATKFLALIVEKLVVLRADRIVWWDGIQMPDDYFEMRYGLSKRVRKTPVGAGFNANSFENSFTQQHDKFTITYAGSFYEGWIEPYNFFEGLAHHQSKYENDLKVQFFGDWNDEYEKRARELDLLDIIEYKGYVPHEEVVPELKGSDLLLYIGGQDSGNSRNVPSKVMDYIGAKRPILAIVDEDFRVANIVEEHSFGIAVSPDLPEAIASAIETVRSGDYIYEPTEAIIEDFSRRHRVEYLAKVYEEVIK